MNIAIAARQLDSAIARKTKPALNESRRVLGGGPLNVPADQQRRVNRLLEQLQP